MGRPRSNAQAGMTWALRSIVPPASGTTTYGKAIYEHTTD